MEANQRKTKAARIIVFASEAIVFDFKVVQRNLFILHRTSNLIIEA